MPLIHATRAPTQRTALLQVSPQRYLLIWTRTVWWELPGLSNLAGSVQHFQSSILDAWRNEVAADLCARSGFRGCPLLDIRGSHQLLNSSHVRKRDKMGWWCLEWFLSW